MLRDMIYNRFFWPISVELGVVYNIIIIQVEAPEPFPAGSSDATSEQPLLTGSFGYLSGKIHWVLLFTVMESRSAILVPFVFN